MIDLVYVIDAKRCFKKILNELKDLDQYREDTGLVDGITDIDFINKLATKGFLKLSKYLELLGMEDDDDE